MQVGLQGACFNSIANVLVKTESVRNSRLAIQKAFDIYTSLETNERLSFWWTGYLLLLLKPVSLQYAKRLSRLHSKNKRICIPLLCQQLLEIKTKDLCVWTAASLLWFELTIRISPGHQTNYTQQRLRDTSALQLLMCDAFSSNSGVWMSQLGQIWAALTQAKLRPLFWNKSVVFLPEGMTASLGLLLRSLPSCCTRLRMQGSGDLLTSQEVCNVFCTATTQDLMSGLRKIKPSYTVFQVHSWRWSQECSKTTRSWLPNRTMQDKKPSLALIICSPDSGSGSLKDKTQTAVTQWQQHHAALWPLLAHWILSIPIPVH